MWKINKNKKPETNTAAENVRITYLLHQKPTRPDRSNQSDHPAQIAQTRVITPPSLKIEWSQYCDNLNLIWGLQEDQRHLFEFPQVQWALCGTSKCPYLALKTKILIDQACLIRLITQVWSKLVRLQLNRERHQILNLKTNQIKIRNQKLTLQLKIINHIFNTPETFLLYNDKNNSITENGNQKQF